MNVAELPAVGEPVGGLGGGLVLGADGVFRPGVVRIDGPVSAAPDAAASLPVVDVTGAWVTPGFVDAHTHLSWSDFDHPDTGLAERAAATSRNRLATLAAGVTTARDAGGYDPALARLVDGEPGPWVVPSIDIIGPGDARGAAYLRRRVAALAEAGAAWIKVAATGGVGAGTAQREPVFDRAEFAAITGEAARAGLPVMVHAWGGPAIDWAVEDGVASIEHAVHLTAAQARRAAATGTFVVPTVWIYADVLRLALAGELPATLVPAARTAVAAHPRAVRHCLEEGVPLAMGTDAGLPTQHGHNLNEVAALVGAGVPVDVALRAATYGGARLVDPGAGVPLAPGTRADVVVFDRDPTDVATLRDPGAVCLVIRDGRVAHRRAVPDASS